MLRRSIMKVVIGLMLLSQAANLLVFTSGGLTAQGPVFLSSAETGSTLAQADPLPQALVLTAIVIGFGVIIFSLSLLLKAHQAVGSDDINAFNKTDQVS